MTTALQTRDHASVWHPCGQMKDYETFPPLEIAKARGSTLTLKDGSTVIDAISSWWCKSLGHHHPRLKAALLNQLEQFEHVILANTTNDTIVELSERLVGMMPHLGKAFYAGDGSCAIEIAMKMSMHARVIAGNPQRTGFMTLENSYHGETLATLSVSDVGIYKDPYQSHTFEPFVIRNIPYVTGNHDPLWHDASEPWHAIEKTLLAHAQTTTAILVEPIVQGAGGMLMYSADFLTRLGHFAKQHNIHLIADEIMTGFGRTGKMLASEYANISPDFVCVSKGLTSGWLPLSAVMTTNAIYDLFYDDYESGKSFLHSHTYTGNALAASVALETFKVMEDDCICEKANVLGKQMREAMQDIANRTHALRNIRQLGAIVAANIETDNLQTRMGYKLYQEAVKQGVLLRPLGNTIYWLPPLNISQKEWERMRKVTEDVLVNVTTTD